jgi:hypothetical protein
MSDDTIRMCIERVLEGDQIREAARRAVEELEDNTPILPMGPDGTPEPLEIAIETEKMWRLGRVLKVRFLDGEAAVQAKVEQIAHLWSQYANIKFAFGDDPDAEIRISFRARGSWSFVGTEALGITDKTQPTMNLGWLRSNSPDEEYHRVVLHEFGHTLGLIHEHNNPAGGIPWDKPAVYRYYQGPPNNWDKDKVDQNLFKKYEVSQTQFTDFDPKSIMIYAFPNELTIGDFVIDWNTKLSEIDKTFIRQRYPYEEPPVFELVVNANPILADIGMHGEEDIYHFNVTSAGTYKIETGGPTNVLMGLFGPNNRTQQIAHDDDSGVDRNAKISKTLQPGGYYLRVRHVNPAETGQYTIAVSR